MAHNQHTTHEHHDECHCHGHHGEGHEHHHEGHEHEGHEHHHDHDESPRELLIKIIAAAVLLAVAVFIEHNTGLATWQLLLIYLIPYLIVGLDTLKEATEGILHGEAFDEHLLMAVATIGALCIGFLPGAETQFPEAVFVMLFFQVGELFEGYAEGRSRQSIAHLMDIRPDTATVVRDGNELIVNPEQVAIGETIILRPGDKVPLDAVITEGATALNTVALTGESLPRQVSVDDEIISGCINISGVVKARVTKTYGESTVSKIIDLVENASEHKSRSEAFITRFARVYTPVVVFAAVALAIVPPLLSPLFSSSFAASFPTWLYRALMFLVVSCPCALVISVPLTFFGGIGGASRKGILIKGANYIDILSKVDTVVFDKTGTLTHGRFAVEAVHPEKYDESHLLHLAAHVEHFSTHPIGAALRDAYPDEATDGCTITDVEEIAGHGIRANVEGSIVCVGNGKLMDAVGAHWHECHLTGTIIHIAIDGDYAGHIVISDQIKEDSADALKELKEIGIRRTVMLTGDSKAVAESVASRLGIDEYHAQLLPQDKVQWMSEESGKRKAESGELEAESGKREAESGKLEAESGERKAESGKRKAESGKLEAESGERKAESGERRTAFVGDGINDAPVLALADVGIAMGGLGSDAAIEAADIVLMDDRPSKIPLAIRIARRTLRIAHQNVVFAIGVKVLVLLLAALGAATMWMAVFADVGVTVIAVFNAMRTLKT